MSSPLNYQTSRSTQARVARLGGHCYPTRCCNHCPNIRRRIDSDSDYLYRSLQVPAVRNNHPMQRTGREALSGIRVPVARPAVDRPHVIPPKTMAVPYLFPLAQLVDILPQWGWNALLAGGMLAPIVGLLISFAGPQPQ